MLLTLVLVLAALAAPVQSEAQTAPVRHTWFATGFGAGAMPGNEGGIVTLEAAHQRGDQLFIVAISGVFELFDDSVGDIGVLYGRGRSSGTLHTHWAAGLAFTEGEGESTIGIPVRLGASWRPAPILGIGIRGLANLNTVGSYAGFAIVLEVGDLR